MKNEMKDKPVNLSVDDLFEIFLLCFMNVDDYLQTLDNMIASGDFYVSEETKAELVDQVKKLMKK